MDPGGLRKNRPPLLIGACYLARIPQNKKNRLRALKSSVSLEMGCWRSLGNLFQINCVGSTLPNLPCLGHGV